MQQTVTHDPFQTITGTKEKNEASIMQFLEKLLCVFSPLFRRAKHFLIIVSKQTCVISGSEVKPYFVVFK